MNWRQLLVLVGLTLALGTVGTWANAVEDATKRQKATNAWKVATVGVCLIELSSGKVVASYNADAALVPASTMKAVTTATAFEILGPSYKFQTQLVMTGELDAEGTLSGDVIIVGGGDPTLGEDDLYGPLVKWRSVLREAGVKRISGRIIADQRTFETALIPRTWPWEDMGNYYGSGACGLNYHANEYRVSFAPRGTGSIARFTGVHPPLPGVEFINEMRTGSPGSGDQGYIYGSPYTKLRYLRGSVPGGRKSFSIRGSLPDPPLFLAQFFKKYLEGKGIPVEGAATTSRILEAAGEGVPVGGKVLDTTQSNTLRSISHGTNHTSINIRAEAILKAIGKKAKQDGSTAAGADAVKDHWAKQGVALSGFKMADGSGLSRVNLVSARQLAAIMQKMATSEHFAAFKKTLPIAGRTGTLKSIGGGTAAEGRVIGKSGTISRIKCYTGYVNGRSGKQYAFAILINNYAGSHGQTVRQIASIMSAMARQ